MIRNGENKPLSPVLITPAKMMPSMYYNMSVVIAYVLDVIDEGPPLRSLN
jgi:hypothetical protein